MIALRVLGEIQLRAADGTGIDSLLRQPKRLALLAYLASPVPGTWHRRDMLLALFWPDLDTAHARTALRNGLYVLRQTLGDDVVRNRGDEEISIDPEKLETDLAHVWNALKRMQVAEALAHYGGELLPGLFPPDSEGFLRWLDSERTRIRVALSSAAMTHVDELERAGNPREGLRVARTVSEINPNDETVVRRLIVLHEAVGDRSGGLAAFEAYRSRLAADFDAEPARETLEIVNRLRSSSGVLLPRRQRPAMEIVRASEDVQASAPQSRRTTTIVLSAVGGAALIAVMALTLSRSEKAQTIGRSIPVTADEGLQVEAAISPNGRLVAYAKGNPNHLKVFVQRIGGGAAWALSTDTVNNELMPRWSPDNDEILFLARNNAYVAPTLGGEPRLVARGSDGDDAIRSASWSPTGDSLAVVRHDSLLVQPLRGRGARLVGRGFQLHSCVWSPDAKWIACVSGNWIAFTPGPLFGNDAPSSIIVFPAAGGDGVTITENDFENESPSWSADGKYLWLLSNRDGDSGQSYSVRIGSDGRRAGPFVKSGLGDAEFLSLSGNRIAYSVRSKRANIWTIPIPRDGTVSMTAATQLTKGNQVIELVTASRDGKWLTYDSNLNGNSDIYRTPVNKDSSEAIATDPRQEFAAELSPDGREIAWQRWVDNKRHLFVKRLDSDSDFEILSDETDRGVPRWSRDGNSIVAWSHDNERGAIFLVKRDASGKWLKPSWRLDYGQLPQWSPDNREIAFVTLDGSIQSIPADSGAVKPIYSPRQGDPLARFIVWVNSGTIWMHGVSGPTQGIWAVPLSTGRPRLLVRLDDSLGKSIGPAFTSDGKSFFFPLNERLSNIRVAELTSH
ncbi:MAG TPA: BTAD domain-containing putative transcriptional regulator [Gemmatimonadaceae bacterium]